MLSQNKFCFFLLELALFVYVLLIHKREEKKRQNIGLPQRKEE
jgi:hypothetical protein